jgi:anaerobic selenocysteine-containing dehydrogenase
VIDPMRTELAEYAQWHLALRPGTNVAVLNMMAYYIIEAGLVNRDFIAKRCEEMGVRVTGLDYFDPLPEMMSEFHRLDLEKKSLPVDPFNYDAVLLVSFGGPDGPDDVLPFLENVLRGRNVPRERMLEVAEHYYHCGGVSPLNGQVREFIAALRPELDRTGINLPIYWGWDQFLLAASFAILSAVIAAYLPARKGGRVDPVDILRGAA